MSSIAGGTQVLDSADGARSAPEDAAPIEASTRNGRELADYEQDAIRAGVQQARAQGASMIAGVGSRRAG